LAPAIAVAERVAHRTGEVLMEKGGKTGKVKSNHAKNLASDEPKPPW
jgi:hypothetical protein